MDNIYYLFFDLFTSIQPLDGAGVPFPFIYLFIYLSETSAECITFFIIFKAQKVTEQDNFRSNYDLIFCPSSGSPPGRSRIPSGRAGTARPPLETSICLLPAKIHTMSYLHKLIEILLSPHIREVLLSPHVFLCTNTRLVATAALICRS